MRLRVLACAVVLAAATACSPAALVTPVLAEPTRGIPDYDRDAFGGSWADADDDCQDTRNEILIRDLEPEQLDAEGCKVLTGVLDDPYTGATIEFRRGQGTSNDVQIDHVIPLSYAWQAGAWEWTAGQRESFANDLAELRAVDGPTNNSKGDRGPSRWLPPNQGVHCAYAARWRDVANAYALVLDPADLDALDGILARC